MSNNNLKIVIKLIEIIALGLELKEPIKRLFDTHLALVKDHVDNDIDISEENFNKMIHEIMYQSDELNKTDIGRDFGKNLSNE